MDGYNIIKRFWDEAPYVDGYKGDHALLFFAVFDLVNRNKWKPKEIGYDQLVERIRLGKKNYLDCRSWLVNHQFLSLKEGRGHYKKARFGMGNAVLSGTASSQENEPDLSPDAVPDSTASSTANDTGSLVDAVPDSTAFDTADETADRTHLKEDNKTVDSKTKKQQQSADSSADDAGVDPVDQVEGLMKAKGFGEEPAADASQNPPPVPPPPLPTADEIRAELQASTAHRRYAVERLKVARTDADYHELIEKWIDQQECTATAGKPAFGPLDQVRHHFKNWLPFQTQKTPQSNGNPNKTTAASGRIDADGTGGFGNWTGNKFGKRVTDS